MAPKRANSKAVPSIDDAAKAALLAEKKGKALVDNTPKRPSKMTLSTAKDSAMTIPPPRALYAPAALKAHHKHHRQASLHQRAKTP
jgi:BRCT domain type II-containing protein